MSGVVEADQPPARTGVGPLGHRGVVREKAHETPVSRQTEKSDERGIDNTPVTRDHHELAGMLRDNVVERVLGPVQELEPGLASRRKGPVRLFSWEASPVTGVALGPTQPVGLARVALTKRASLL